jgi:hypothetical protein
LESKGPQKVCGPLRNPELVTPVTAARGAWGKVACISAAPMGRDR